LGAIRRLVDGLVAKAGLAVSDSGAHLVKGERNAAAMVARSLRVGTGEGAPAKGVKYAVHVVIDHTALVRGRTADGETCEIPGVGPVDVAWVREILGSAFVTAIVTKGKDIRTVAHLGRHIPAEIQTALSVSGRECDCCDHRGYLERDHTIGVAEGGPTA